MCVMSCALAMKYEMECMFHDEGRVCHSLYGFQFSISYLLYTLCRERYFCIAQLLRVGFRNQWSAMIKERSSKNTVCDWSRKIMYKHKIMEYNLSGDVLWILLLVKGKSYVNEKVCYITWKVATFILFNIWKLDYHWIIDGSDKCINSHHTGIMIQAFLLQLQKRLKAYGSHGRVSTVYSVCSLISDLLLPYLLLQSLLCNAAVGQGDTQTLLND